METRDGTSRGVESGTSETSDSSITETARAESGGEEGAKEEEEVAHDGAITKGKEVRLASERNEGAEKQESTNERAGIEEKPEQVPTQKIDQKPPMNVKEKA